MFKSHRGAVTQFKYLPIKIVSCSCSEFWAQPWLNKETFKIGMSIYFCEVPLQSSFIEFFRKQRHINVTDHTADIKKAQNSQLDPLVDSSKCLVGLLLCFQSL